MPFAAVVGGAATAGAFGLLQALGLRLQGYSNGWLDFYVVQTLSAAVFGWVYIYIACAIAPHGKAVTGVVMATILAVLCIGNVGLAWTWSAYTNAESIQTTLTHIASSTAAILGAVTTHAEERRRRERHLSATAFATHPLNSLESP